MTRALVLLAAVAALVVAAARPDLGPPGAPTAAVAGPASAPTAAPASGYRWPTTTPPTVLRPFLAPAQRWSAGHRGVDLAVGPGEPVLAAGPGVVVAAGPVAGRPVVSVAHGDGLRTTYEPVAPLVRPGDVVHAGDVLGTLGPSGHCAQPCLHWGARRGAEEYVDPLLLVRRPLVRLYP